MGIFNEQSFDHPFAKGIQGAPGVGFSLTADGNYDISGKKLTNVGAPSNNTCLLYTSPSPRDGLLSRMPSSA